jgi:ferredoxin
MAYYITEDCISCGACEPECPNQAITGVENEFSCSEIYLTDFSPVMGHH